MQPLHRRPLHLHFHFPRRRSIVSLTLLLLLTIGLILVAKHALTGKEYAVDFTVVEGDREYGFTGRPLTKVLVLASYKGQEGLQWLDEVPSDWTIYRYLHIDNSEKSQAHNANTSRQMTTITLSSNQGREALAYVTFLATHYDALPDVMFFTHGADRSWHAPARTIHRLRALNLSALLSAAPDLKRPRSRGGYIALRCAASPTCASSRSSLDLSRGPAGMGKTLSPVKLLPAFWAYVFPEEKDLPTQLAAPWGGEFAVSRAAVQRRSRAFWERLKQVLESDLEPVDRQLKEWSLDRWGEEFSGPERKDLFEGQMLHANDAYVVGSLFEHMWHFLFGMDAYHCPGPDACEKTFFAGVINCEVAGIRPDAFGGFPEWEHKSCHIDEGALARVERQNALLRWNG